MNTGLRFDWLTLSIEGDFDFKNAILEENFEPIPGIPMYLHGYQGDFFRIYVQADYNNSYPVAVLQYDHSLLWGGRYDLMFDILAGISDLPGFYSYHVTRVDLSVLIDHNFFENGLESFLSKCKGKVRTSNVKHVGSGGQVETVYLGTRQKVFMRVYDKMKELMSHNDNQYKEYVFDEVKEWKNCYNVEYELRRQWLKEFGINSLGDLMGMMESGELWRYLTGTFFYMGEDYITKEWEEVKGAKFMSDGKMYEEMIDIFVQDIDKERIYAAMRGMIKRLSYVEPYYSVKSNILQMIEGARDIDKREREKEKRFRVKRREDPIREDTDKDRSEFEEEIQVKAIE